MTGSARITGSFDVSGSGRFTNNLTVTGSVNVSGSVYLRNNQYLRSDFSGGVFNIGVFGVDTNDSIVIGSSYAAGGIVGLTSGVRYDMKATGMGINTASPSAMLHVKGSGTTGATTALLVQNSAGNDLIKIFDSGQIYIPQPASTSLYLDTIAGYNTDRISISRLVTGTGVSGMNASAQLEIQSTTKGFLPPRMTNAQRVAITSPAVGLMVYCTDATEGLYIYKSTGWTFIA